MPEFGTAEGSGKLTGGGWDYCRRSRASESRQVELGVLFRSSVVVGLISLRIPRRLSPVGSQVIKVPKGWTRIQKRKGILQATFQVSLFK